MKKISDKRRFFEILASIITGLGKILFYDVLNQSLVFIVVASLFWVGYLAFRSFQDKNILKYWGFTKNNFNKSFIKLLPYAVILTATFFIYGLYFNTLILSIHIFPLFLLYPLWGIIQQYLTVGLIAGNLKDQKKIKINTATIILITSISFSIVHYPSKMLMIGTFALSIIYTIEYLKERNLWVLGIYHGYLACLYYYFVLHRDPFVEVFGILFK